MKRCDRVILSMAIFFPMLGIHSALAQVTSDRTTNTSIRGNCANTCTIEGGTRARQNLFHSFRSFSIPMRGTVRFSDPGVTNILVRITGGDRSTLRGTLAVDGGANLFLLNPHGILFSQNAQLDMKGSFVATTANALQFGNQGVFSTAKANDPTPLTISPSAFLFNQAHHQTSSDQTGFGAIESHSTATQNQNERAGLSVPANRSLVLLGREIRISGFIRSPGSQVQLGGLANEGEVELAVKANRLRLQFPDQVPQSAVALEPPTSVEGGITSVEVGGGSLRMHGRSLIVNGSSLDASALRGQAGGTIDINIQGQISLTDSSISSDSGRAERAGRVEIRAGEGLSLQNSGIYAEALKSSGGSIRVQARNLSLSGNSTLSTTTSGSGDAGPIAVTTEDFVQLEDSYIVSDASLSSTRLGNAGRIQIQTRELRLKGSSLNTTVDDTGQQRGQGGNIELNARIVSLEGESTIFATTGSTDGGNITLRNGNLLLLNDRSSISTSAGKAQGSGNGGAIDLQSQLVVANPLTNNDITANAYKGSGGSVTIDGNIFGLAPRSRDDLRQLLGTDDPNQIDPALLPSSDISAISQTQPDTRQSVNLTTTDLSRGLVTLPIEAIDAATLISRTCRISGRDTGSFTVTGRGGLPASPADPSGGAAVLTDWADLQDRENALMGENFQVSEQAAESNWSRGKINDSRISSLPLVEAQGWVVNLEGKVMLRAEAPEALPQNDTAKLATQCSE